MRHSLYRRVMKQTSIDVPVGRMGSYPIIRPFRTLAHAALRLPATLLDPSSTSKHLFFILSYGRSTESDDSLPFLKLF